MTAQARGLGRPCALHEAPPPSPLHARRHQRPSEQAPHNKPARCCMHESRQAYQQRARTSPTSAGLAQRLAGVLAMNLSRSMPVPCAVITVSRVH